MQSSKYDKPYLEDKNAFSKVHKIIESLLDHTSSGSVFDIGAGGGGNSLFLAKHGFNVTAMDTSQVAMDLLKERTAIENVAIETEVGDIAQYAWNRSYNVIVCTFVLHFLLTEKAIECIKNMQMHTKDGGFNVIATFTKQGDLLKGDPETRRFLVDGPDTLKELYADWDIHTLFEKETTLRKKGLDGAPLKNMFVGLIAQKRDFVGSMDR